MSRARRLASDVLRGNFRRPLAAVLVGDEPEFIGQQEQHPMDQQAQGTPSAESPGRPRTDVAEVSTVHFAAGVIGDAHVDRSGVPVSRRGPAARRGWARRVLGEAPVSRISRDTAQRRRSHASGQWVTF